jgi:YYY domain-containing protein
MIPSPPFPRPLRHVIWLAPLLVACLAWQFAGPIALDAAAPHGRDVLRGFYAPESGPHGAFRWSERHAGITLPALTSPAALLLRGAVAPDGTRVSLGIGGRMLAELPPADALVGRTYRLLIPKDAVHGGLMSVTLSAAPPERPIETRPLGMALSTVSLHPLGAGPRLPPLGLLAALVALPPLLAVCLGAAGVRPLPARLVSVLAVSGVVLVALARPLAAVPPLLDLSASLGAAPVLRWLAAVALVGVASLPITAFLFRTLPLRGLLFARAAGLVLAGWLCWLLAAGVRVPFGVGTVALALLLLAAAGAWALRRSGLREVAGLLRSRWRALVAAETFFLAAFLAGLWLRWNGAVGPAISGTEKPMDLALLQGALRDPRFPPADVWFAGEPVNYYYLGYVQLAAVAKLAGVTAGEAFNLGMATLFALTALMAAALAATLVALHRRAAAGASPETTDDRPPTPDARPPTTDHRPPTTDHRPPTTPYALVALLGVVLLLLAGNQLGALQLLLGGSQVRVLDGGQLAEALWQRLAGAETIVLSRPTPPAPDFGRLGGWTPADEPTFDWYGPSRIVLDDIPTGDGTVERRQAITEFPFFSFYLGDLHAHLLALPHGLLILALALATLARPTLPVYLLTPRGWLELALTGAVLGSLYSVNAWDAPGWWLLFFGALALLYRRSAVDGRTTKGARPMTKEQGATARPRRSSLALRLRSVVSGRWLPHFVQSALALGLAMLAAAGPFLATYRSPFGGTPGARPWEGVPLLEALGRVVGPAPDHTRLHVFVAMFGLFLLPLLALAATAAKATLRPRLQTIAWAAVALTLLIGQALGFPLLALLALAAWLALLAWRDAANPAWALALWGAAVAALLVLAADTVYVRDQLEGYMSRYITVFKLYFQAWTIWGTLAAYAVWAALFASGRGSRAATRLLPLVARGAWLALLAGALVYPAETLRRGEPWGQPARDVDGLAFIGRRTPDEAAAIAWLGASAGIDETVLTAWCECAPDEVGRVAAASGVPTLLGRSEGHQRLWRGGSAAWLAEIVERERDIPRIYQTEDGGEALRLLQEYGVDYVYVGALERAVHGGPGLAKFEELLEPAFARGAVRVYRVQSRVTQMDADEPADGAEQDR